MLQLGSTYTGNADGSATLHVNQMPPNAAAFPPGPARKFSVSHLATRMRLTVIITSGLRRGQQRALRRCSGHDRQRQDRKAAYRRRRDSPHVADRVQQWQLELEL